MRDFVVAEVPARESLFTLPAKPKEALTRANPNPNPIRNLKKSVCEGIRINAMITDSAMRAKPASV